MKTMKSQFVILSLALAITGGLSLRPLAAQPFRASFPSSTNTGPGERPVATVAATADNRNSTTNPGTTPLPNPDLYEPTAVLATVGPEYILAGDIMPQVEIVMWLMFKDEPKAQLDKHRREIEMQKKMLLRNLLIQAIDSKILYLAFKRSMKTEELEEFEERASEVINSAFASSIKEILPKVKTADKAEMKRLRATDMQVTQLCTLMVEHQVDTLRELDKILRTFGSSLDQAKQEFAETNFGRQAIATDVKLNYEITHQDLLDYYYDNVEDYKITEAVSFEQLTVEFKNHQSKQQAYQKICALGNSVLQGAPFEKVAAAQSEGPKAKSGGKYETIEKGDLVSEKVEQVAFDIPVNRMSPVIEDEKGFYIIRVNTHRPEGREKFTEVQGEIELTIKNQRRNKAIQKYISKVKKHVPVWNSLEQSKP